MRQPALLNKSTLAEVSRIQCDSLSITINEVPPSTASMSISDTTVDINVGNWVRIFTPQNASFVAVVTSIETDYATGARTVNAEHVYRLLNDEAVIGTVNPGGASNGNPKDCTPTVAINAALAYQSNWTLTSVSYTDKMPYSFANESVMNAIDSVLDTLDGYQLELNTDAYPFAMKIIQRPTDTTSEMRLNRNISTMRVSVDRSDMWNKFYPFGNKDITIDGYSVEDFPSISAWGLVEHTATINSITDKKTLKAYAEALLKKYSTPLVTITISGLELSNTTGESIDRLTVGKLCRVPLPKYGVTYTERITKLTWSDALKNPEAVTVTMCNNRQTVNLLSNTVKNTVKHSRSTSRSISKVSSDTTNAINGFAGDLASAWTSIEQNESQIQLAAQLLTGNTTLTSSISITGGGIVSRVSSVENTATGLSNTVGIHTSQISQLADSINLKADTVTVDAQIANINAAITNLGNIVNGGVIQASSVTTNGLGVNGAFYYHEERVTPTQITSTSRERYSVLGIV